MNADVSTIQLVPDDEVDMNIEDLNSERRAFPRTYNEIAIKLRRSAHMMFTSGKTIDVSQCGASLELVGPREAHEGERIAIAFEDLQCPVTRASKMIGAQIVRVQPAVDGHQRIAVRFDSHQTGIVSLGRPIAA